MDLSPIISKRLMLRPFTMADAPQLYAAVDSSRRELGEWLDWCHTRYTPEDAVTYIERSLVPASWKETLNFGVFRATPDGELLGSAGLSKIDWNASVGNLGYWIRTDQTGQGFATEAASALADHARRKLGIARVEIAVHPQNARSARVARSLGARDEGLVPARIVYRGHNVAAHVFSLS